MARRNDTVLREWSKERYRAICGKQKIEKDTEKERYRENERKQDIERMSESKI